MINPSTKHDSKATVTSATRRNDGTLRDIEFLTESGSKLIGAYGLEHKTIMVGDSVNVRIGFRISSDKYVVESFKRVPEKKR